MAAIVAITLLIPPRIGPRLRRFHRTANRPICRKVGVGWRPAGRRMRKVDAQPGEVVRNVRTFGHAVVAYPGALYGFGSGFGEVHAGTFAASSVACLIYASISRR